MKENFKNEVLFYTFPEFEAYPELIHAFSSREGGVSSGYYSSMNLGLKTPDDFGNVKRNYEIFCDTIGVDVNQVVIANLNHEANIKNVTGKDAGAGLFRPFEEDSIDGLLTDEPGLVLTATFADCVPVFFYEPIKRIIGIAHSGWRGTAAGISGKMVERMVSDYGCNPDEIRVGIGPSIGVCCYEVDKDVCEEFVELPFLSEEGWFYRKDNGKFDLNLWRIIYDNLLFAGVSKEHISVSGLCTCCNSDVLFSHRASRGKRGTMAGMICLKST